MLVLGTQEPAQQSPAAPPPSPRLVSGPTTQQKTPALLEATKVLGTPEDTHSTGGHAGIRNPSDHIGIQNPRSQASSQNPRTPEAKQAPQAPEAKQTTKTPAETHYWT